MDKIKNIDINNINKSKLLNLEDIKINTKLPIKEVKGQLVEKLLVLS